MKDSTGVTDVKIDTKIDVTEKTTEKQGSLALPVWVIIVGAVKQKVIQL